MYIFIIINDLNIITANLEELQHKKLQSDNQLISLYLETQKSKYFDILYQKYELKVYRKCISLLKNEMLAKDATQDIFLKLFLNLSKFGGKSKFSTWVYSITYNYCIDIIRKNKKTSSVFSDEIENVPDLAEEVSDNELVEMQVDRLKKVLDDIPTGDKALLLMKYQEDMSIKEIATALEKSESAIKMRLKRAKSKAKQTYIILFNS